jgi:antitoxin ParD1/3/4
MPTRNVVLTDHQHEVIETLVSSGRYQNASEVLREGLRLIEQCEAEEAAKLAGLLNAAQVGWSDVQAGRYRDLDHDGLAEHVERLGERAGERLRARS